MREGWEYKKLGEVCTIKAGYTPQKNELSDNGAYPYYKVADMNTLGNDVYLDITSSYKIDANKLFPKGAIVFPKNGAAVSTNKKRILKYDSIVDLNTGVAIFPKSINEKFAYYWFIDTDFKKYVRGGALPTLDIKSLKDKTFPSIDKSIQLAIVSELDKINELIRLKKEQLKDLDKLAQSIFYEMFGDPVENEMGWEVKKLGEVCTFSQGMQVPIEKQKVMQHEGDVRFLRIIDFTQGKDAPRYVECDNDKYILHEKEIAIVRYGTPGFVCTGLVGAIANNLFKLNPISDNTFIFEYLVHWLSSNAFQSSIKGRQYGAALQAIKFSTIQNINILIPPLPLQHLFAHRIEQIEHQKAEVQKAIADLETLLASRMQYWFE